MKLGEEHCRDERDGLDAHPLKPSIGVMRRLRGDEHSACRCGGMWTGNGYARMVGNELLEHLICTRCGYRWVTDHRSIKAGFAIPQSSVLLPKSRFDPRRPLGDGHAGCHDP